MHFIAVRCLGASDGPRPLTRTRWLETPQHEWTRGPPYTPFSQRLDRCRLGVTSPNSRIGSGLGSRATVLCSISSAEGRFTSCLDRLCDQFAFDCTWRALSRVAWERPVEFAGCPSATMTMMSGMCTCTQLHGHTSYYWMSRSKR